MNGHVSPDELSRQLRTGRGPFLDRRRKIVGLSLFSSAVLGGIALYQMGILRRLPGPKCGGLDAERIHGSAQAYSSLNTPDALLGIMSYAVTASLAGWGSEDRSRTDPIVPLGMSFKVVTDVILTVKLTIDERRKFRAFSLWSLLAAAATWLALPLTIPEARAAICQLTGKDD